MLFLLHLLQLRMLGPGPTLLGSWLSGLPFWARYTGQRLGPILGLVVCHLWKCSFCTLHRFFIAVARAVVNHVDGDGTAPDPLVWSAGALPKRRRLVHAVRDRAFLSWLLASWRVSGLHFLLLLSLLLMLGLGHTLLDFWLSLLPSWGRYTGLWLGPALGFEVFLLLRFILSVLSRDGQGGALLRVVAKPYSVSMLVNGHWPQDGVGLGVGGVSHVELLILYELWAGERLVLENAVPRYRRPGRPISVSAAPFRPGTDIWRSCRFVGALFRALRAMPGGIGRFILCDVGAEHCRLRHIGWEKNGHRLNRKTPAHLVRHGTL